MTKENLVTARGEVTLEEAEKILTAKKVEKLLLVDEKYALTGLITIKDIDMMKRFPMLARIVRGVCGLGRRSESWTMIERKALSRKTLMCLSSTVRTVIRPM
jgi:CBS-domain-containing membrane protein